MATELLLSLFAIVSPSKSDVERSVFAHSRKDYAYFIVCDLGYESLFLLVTLKRLNLADHPRENTGFVQMGPTEQRNVTLKEISMILKSDLQIIRK